MAIETEIVISTALRFLVKLLVVMVFFFWAHLLIINQSDYSVPGGLLKICYIFNTVIAGIFMLLFLFVSKNQTSILGWVFLLTSGLKFLFFFALIYPHFQSQVSESKLDFLTFFVPYTAALTLEIYQLIKILNQEE